MVIDLAKEPDFSLGRLRVCPSSREVVAAGQAEALEPRVMQVLVALARQRGEVVSRDRLVELCWAGRVVGDDAINRCIARIRRLSEAHGSFALETIPRIGYRLTESAQLASTAGEPDVIADAVVSFPQTASSSHLDTSVRASRRWMRIALITVALLAIALLVKVNAPGLQPPPAAVTSATPGKPRLALLPFQNLSPDPANAFFTDGVHEEILSALAMRGNALEVIPRTTMMMYRVTPQSIPRIVADLNATHVVEGSMRREGNSVRLIVQLIDARTQQYLWSHTYDRQLVNAFNLQSEVAAKIASQLSAELGSPTAVTPPTTNPEAYDLYLKAKLMQVSGAWDNAASLLDQAVKIDPEFGAAYAARAQFHFFKIVDSSDASETRLQMLRADVDAAGKGLGTAAPLVMALEATYANLAARDNARAIRSLEAAEAAGLTDSITAWQRAAMLMLDDRIDEAIVLLQSLVARDPGNLQILRSLPRELAFARRPADALRVANLLAQRFPERKFLETARGKLKFRFSGASDGWRQSYAQNTAAQVGTVAIASGYIDLLRFEKRYAELERVLADVSVASVPIEDFNGFSICCVGHRPMAAYRGWTDLLTSNAEVAAMDGRVVLDFVATTTPTRWNPWYLRTLTAEGLLFAGNKAAAVAAAREALRLSPREIDTIRFCYTNAVAARIFAWAGAEDEAVAILEQLAVLKPGLSPAEITRDPLYSIPLARNARYQALAKRLEAELQNHSIELQNIGTGI